MMELKMDMVMPLLKGIITQGN